MPSRPPQDPDRTEGVRTRCPDGRGDGMNNARAAARAREQPDRASPKIGARRGALCSSFAKPGIVLRRPPNRAAARTPAANAVKLARVTRNVSVRPAGAASGAAQRRCRGLPRPSTWAVPMPCLRPRQTAKHLPDRRTPSRPGPPATSRPRSAVRSAPSPPHPGSSGSSLQGSFPPSGRSSRATRAAASCEPRPRSCRRT